MVLFLPWPRFWIRSLLWTRRLVTRRQGLGASTDCAPLSDLTQSPTSSRGARSPGVTMLRLISRSDGSNAKLARASKRAARDASGRPVASVTDGGGGLVCGLLRRRLLGWLSLAIAAVLFVPAAASAAYILTGKTAQGLPVSVRLSSNLSTVTRFTIGWRATCSPGGSLSEATLASKPIAVRPFPNFHRTGSYAFSTVSNGQTLHVFASVQLHGALARNGRASGTWATQARVLDASGNQLAFCRTGVVGWRARF
jgi:hypothetical protein